MLRSGHAVWPYSIDATASDLIGGGGFEIGRYPLARNQGLPKGCSPTPQRPRRKRRVCDNCQRLSGGWRSIEARDPIDRQSAAGSRT
jgi:hypothetical protein